MSEKTDLNAISHDLHAVRKEKLAQLRAAGEDPFRAEWAQTHVSTECPGLLPEGVEHAARYDLVLWCRPDIPWVADPGQRDGPEYRALVDDRIAMFVRDDLTPAGIDVLELSGSPEDRLAIAQAALNGLAIPPFRAWQPPASDPAK